MVSKHSPGDLFLGGPGSARAGGPGVVHQGFPVLRRWCDALDKVGRRGVWALGAGDEVRGVRLRPALARLTSLGSGSQLGCPGF